VLVIETVSTVEEFANAVRKVEGMEWLGEIEAHDLPPDRDFFFTSADGTAKDKPLRGRLFLIFSDQQALKQLRSLWIRWQRDEKLPHGLGRWEKVFDQLHDIRAWGVRDRLTETGVLDDWRERVEMGVDSVTVEVELWHRATEALRQTAEHRVRGLIAADKGEVIAQSIIADVGYHALLARLPIQAVKRVLDAPDTVLVQCEQIQFFRASGQMAAPILGDERVVDDWTPPEGQVTAGETIAALLDGFPLQLHRRLAGRLVVDDPDDFESACAANRRVHGTAMASLILHGDLSGSEPALQRPLYVRPILQPHSAGWATAVEVVPESVLVVDLVHRAVRRIFEGEGDQPAVAPSVRVINLSLGIRDRPFERSMSPLARLLDWLAWKYQVLIVVSAGNHGAPIELETATGQLTDLPAAELQRQVLRALNDAHRHRRLLSPAESVNALTIGALQADQAPSGPIYNGWNPYHAAALAGPLSAQGPGLRRSVKPDLLMPGGRAVYTEAMAVATGQPARLEFSPRPLYPPGQRAAAPGAAEGDLDRSVYSCGTSNATALATRGAAQLYEVMEELRAEPNGEIVDAVPRALWLKVLLAHGADWRDAATAMEAALGKAPNGSWREQFARFLGYGAAAVDRVAECTPYRVTALSGAQLLAEQGHVHRFPLPPLLATRVGWRRLTVTLAWFTPINTAHQKWRRAHLWFADPSHSSPLSLKRDQCDDQAVQRGTLQHEIFEGNEAAPFLDGAAVEVQINCRADAGDLDEPVPYALAVTLEVAESLGIQIYEQVRARVVQQIQVTPTN
jgi:hypothetical protein